MNVRVGVIDYHSGNIRSVVNAVEHAGGEAAIISEASELQACSHALLPGVGAFGFCAQRLQASGMTSALEHWAFTVRKPLLGICVGMQLMADVSEEQGEHRGLGWMGGRVRRLTADIPQTIRVPHVGWNEVHFREAFGQFKEGERPNFYFDHSFAYEAPTLGVEVGVCVHGRQFSALIRRDNIVAAQFHPEKSQGAGMRLLRSFFEM